MLHTDETSSTSARWITIYDELKSAILAHSVAPGTKLPEDELGEVFSVSRTIVRTALQALAHDRLVQLKPNRGAFVAKPTKKEAREIFGARALIEPRVAAMAAAVAKPSDIEVLRKHLEEEHRALYENRQGDAVLLSARFHESIAEIAGQSILTEFVRSLCSRSALIISLYSRRDSPFCESHAHAALVDAIAANNEAEASELMTRHLADLLSGIDVSDREPQGKRLAEVLRRS
ncbi:GntR family transcriptional regulator (plasmid) [Ketogulonicigenium robustum]|uniref:GntR family transcriptional regulator n=1 Tax=Ketogulonicigenium robustum TaxID=92947 RepID=A0A1W6P398_9RHOB|nr:GntR family transcriptional regulator [Ketogulonicigenium robustum]ARO15807.1 GntR family transcriptional regulator [Ketogulonicigenium robustum]